MIDVNCLNCGKAKRVFPSRFKRHKEHFCNRECYKKYHSKTEFKTTFIPCTTYVDGPGRARIHCPQHKRSDKYGYTLRSIVHWEWFNNCEVPEGCDVHHKDKNRLNDSNENLEIIEHAEHSRLHHTKQKIKLECCICGKKFERVPNRVRYENVYCSQECYNGRKKRK